MRRYLAYAWMQFILYFKQGKFELEPGPVESEYHHTLRRTHWQDMDGNWWNEDGRVKNDLSYKNTGPL